MQQGRPWSTFSRRQGRLMPKEAGIRRGGHRPGRISGVRSGQDHRDFRDPSVLHASASHDRSDHSAGDSSRHRGKAAGPNVPAPRRSCVHPSSSNHHSRRIRGLGPEAGLHIGAAVGYVRYRSLPVPTRQEQGCCKGRRRRNFSFSSFSLPGAHKPPMVLRSVMQGDRKTLKPLHPRGNVGTC